MATKWKWLEDGVSVELLTEAREVIVYKATQVKEVELVDFSNRFTLEEKIYSTLKAAYTAFSSGLADYSGAVANLRALLSETHQIAESVRRTAMDVEAFFLPLGLATKFDKDGNGLIEFAKQFVLRAYLKEPGK